MKMKLIIHHNEYRVMKNFRHKRKYSSFTNAIEINTRTGKRKKVFKGIQIKTY